MLGGEDVIVQPPPDTGRPDGGCHLGGAVFFTGGRVDDEYVLHTLVLEPGVQVALDHAVVQLAPLVGRLAEFLTDEAGQCIPYGELHQTGFGALKGKLKGKQPKNIKKEPCNHCGYRVQTWRRRRDSNSRDPYEAYTISSRARSTNYATSPSMAYRENDMQFWVSKKVVGLQGLEPGTVRL